MLGEGVLREGLLEERAYQVAIAHSCLEKNTLVVLPTGMGKTVIAAFVLAETLRRRGGRVLFLAPTKPLVEQHGTFLRRVLAATTVADFTGEVPPEERMLLWRDHAVIVSTPQVVENDLVHERVALDDVHLVILDETHRAVGDYAYVYVAQRFRETGGLILGMTASPGSDPERIVEVCQNLGIANVEIRTEYDPDVVEYFHHSRVETVRVPLPDEVDRIRRMLRGALEDIVSELRPLGFLTERKAVITRDLLAAGETIRARLRGGGSGPMFRAATLQAAAMKVNHALELAETQGAVAVRQYLDRMSEEAREPRSARATKLVVQMEKVKEAMRLAAEPGLEQPKVEKLLRIVAAEVAQRPEARVIAFTHYRDTAELVTRALEPLPGVRPARFVGQATKGEDRGLSQREQNEILQRFRDGEYNVLVATAVGEEGLDIPQVDLVVFYEPVPSEIRTIQRRGRTGRARPGRVVVIVSAQTRDEAYFYSAKRKERAMHEQLVRLREALRGRLTVGRPLGEYAGPTTVETPAVETVEVAPARGKGQAKLSDY